MTLRFASARVGAGPRPPRRRSALKKILAGACAILLAAAVVHRIRDASDAPESAAIVLHEPANAGIAATEPNRGRNGNLRAGASDIPAYDTTHVSSIQQRRGKAPRRTVEQGVLLPSGALDGSALASTMHSTRFPAFVESIGSRLESPLAADIQDMYASAISQQLAGKGESLKLGRFACGEIICAGSIETPSSDEWQAWMRAFAEDPRTKSYVFMEEDVDDGSGAIEHRFVFSTDPGANRISVPEGG